MFSAPKPPPSQISAYATVSLSLPAFWEKETIAWFKCVDVFLTSQRICKESEMFDHVLKRLPPKYLAPLSDVQSVRYLLIFTIF